MITKEEISQLFSYFVKNESEKFFDQVIDDVQWTVMGTHPLAGHYNSKRAFLDAIFYRLSKILQKGIISKIKNIYLDNMTAIVEMESLSTANNGKPFDNKYCWITKFNEENMIISVRAYVDSALVTKVIEENE